MGKGRDVGGGKCRAPPCSKLKAPGPSIVPAAKLYPMAGGQVWNCGGGEGMGGEGRGEERRGEEGRGGERRGGEREGSGRGERGGEGTGEERRGESGGERSGVE